MVNNSSPCTGKESGVASLGSSQRSSLGSDDVERSRSFGDWLVDVEDSLVTDHGAGSRPPPLMVWACAIRCKDGPISKHELFGKSAR
jgi:hypothetical protein